MRERRLSSSPPLPDDIPDIPLFDRLSIGTHTEEPPMHRPGCVTAPHSPERKWSEQPDPLPSVTVNVTVNIHAGPQPAIDALSRPINAPAPSRSPRQAVNVHASRSPLPTTTSSQTRKPTLDYADTWHPPRTQSGGPPAPERVQRNASLKVDSEGEALRSNAVVRGGGVVAPWNPDLEYIEPVDHGHRRKWYVVIAGRRVGIWKSWLDMEDYIDVKGRRYQSFDSRDAAEHHYNLAKSEGRVRLLSG
ncbi:hypothetical protein GY45DRAFT_1374261 [Cubamyces sp. BRFM 1775]|nr:hypothetical protein GY45DRAFT_1374261 [Cubamyces sp. BRFM 1775]